MPAKLNDTAATYPADRCAHELFEEQARRTPGAPALVFQGEQLTYAELDDRSDQLASELRGHRVGAGQLVGLCVDRSLEMAIGLLGILKAGSAYLPLDPAYPPEWLAYMLHDAKPSAMVTQAQILEHLPEHEMPIVQVSRSSVGAPVDAHPSVVQPDARRLAYVIYTSGSTGRPKGVQITHRSLVNLLWSARHMLEIGQGDTLLAVTSLSFDPAAMELLLPLIVGAKAHIVSHSTATDGIALRRELEASGATVLHATPSGWRLLIEAGWQGGTLKTAISGGEVLSERLAGELLQRAECVWNVYGPTETTIWSTAHLVDDGHAPPPIGRPIANTQVFVLDDQLRPLPPGAKGELCVGGDGLARGYLNRPDLTARSFVRSPLAGSPGSRLYRTGDLVRYRDDGALVFLGRVDDQVKVRGFRIEPGEIEAALSRHPDLAEAAVTAYGPDEDRRLAAYFAPAPGRSPTRSALRSFLRGVLPAHMIPGTIVQVVKLPRAPNGKVDRRALPPPDQQPTGAGGPDTPPADELERHLSQLWAELLGLDRPVAVTDDFFELGGDSLSAVRLLLRIKETTGRAVPSGALFEQATVRSVATAIRTAADAGSRLVVPVHAGTEAPPLFWVELGHGIAGISPLRHLTRGLPVELSLYGLVTEEAPSYGPGMTVERLAAECLAEVRDIQPTGPYRLIGYCFGALVAYQMAVELTRAGEGIDHLALIDGIHPALRGVGSRARMRLRRLTAGGPQELASYWRRRSRRLSRRLQSLQARPPSSSVVDDGEDEGDEVLPDLAEALEITRRYHPPGYNGRVSIVVARMTAERWGDDLLGWERCVRGPLEHCVLAGTHVSIVKEPAIPELVAHCLPTATSSEREATPPAARTSEMQPCDGGGSG